jgi:hypothetical protein
VAPRTLSFLAIDAIGFAVDILGMTNPAANDPVLKQFRTALDRTYGDRLERVVLFGSRARGDAHPIRIMTSPCF